MRFFPKKIFSLLLLLHSGGMHAETRRLDVCEFIPNNNSALAKRVQLPHVWETDPDMGSKGFGTYVCQVHFDEPSSARQMTIYDLGEAYRIDVNGQTLYQKGQVSEHPQSMIATANSTVTVNLPSAEDYEIVLQVVNVSGSWSGIARAPEIGESQELAQNFLSNIYPLVVVLAMGSLLALYNVIMYWSNRKDKTSLYLALIGFATFARYMAIAPFHILQYLSPNCPDWVAWKLEYVGFILTSMLCLKVIYSIFDQPTKIFEKIFLYLGSGFTALVLLTSIDVYRLMLRPWQVLCLLATLFLIRVIRNGIRGNLRESLIFVSGGTIWVTLTLLEIYLTYKLEASPPYGLLGVFAFCLTNSYIVLSRNAAVHVALRRQRAISNHAFDQIAKIVYPHQLGQMKSGLVLEETMPTHISEAVVIAFDIIGSSKIKHERVKEFMENAMRACVAVMNENYDASTRCSNGYRIKEMGDGFLCSIGFPFVAPVGTKIADHAVSMAFRFIEAFQKEVEAFQYESPIYCSMGIAHGTIQGYYPMSEPKEYSIYGQAVVLATRYESMRKVLFENLSSHAVIIQEKIYYSLSREWRKKFIRVAISESISIPDDKEAEEVFYHLASGSVP